MVSAGYDTEATPMMVIPDATPPAGPAKGS
jgi:hypothetical protein